MSVIKLVKVLVVLLTMSGFAQNVTLAGKFSVNGFVSIALASQNSTQTFQRYQPRKRMAQSSGRRISPSAALRAAKRVAPGSKALGVRFMPGRQGYIVTLKTRGRIRRVFVDARNGRVGR